LLEQHICCFSTHHLIISSRLHFTTSSADVQWPPGGITISCCNGVSLTRCKNVCCIPFTSLRAQPSTVSAALSEHTHAHWNTTGCVCVVWAGQEQGSHHQSHPPHPRFHAPTPGFQARFWVDRDSNIGWREWVSCTSFTSAQTVLLSARRRCVFFNLLIARRAKTRLAMRTVTGSVTMPMLLLATPLLADDQHGCTPAHRDHDSPSFRKGT
jgi:hypothetical protein